MAAMSAGTFTSAVNSFSAVDAVRPFILTPSWIPPPLGGGGSEAPAWRGDGLRFASRVDRSALTCGFEVHLLVGEFVTYGHSSREAGVQVPLLSDGCAGSG